MGEWFRTIVGEIRRIKLTQQRGSRAVRFVEFLVINDSVDGPHVEIEILNSRNTVTERLWLTPDEALAFAKLGSEAAWGAVGLRVRLQIEEKIEASKEAEIAPPMLREGAWHEASLRAAVDRGENVIPTTEADA